MLEWLAVLAIHYVEFLLFCINSHSNSYAEHKYFNNIGLYNQ